MLCGESFDVGHPEVELIHVNGQEHDARAGRALVVVGVDKLLGHDRANVSAVGIEELQHNDLAPEGIHGAWRPAGP